MLLALGICRWLWIQSNLDRLIRSLNFDRLIRSIMFLPPECIEKLELYCIPLGLAPQNYSERQQRNDSQGSWVPMSASS